ncbi:dna-directed rna polymerase ii rpb11a [Cystoisospora suis]|uniref:Dna-directed rna polymerase ii rpb11a n=1 Tax=Cystoisospora suis TaxID=483139 RepID=A0A2C6L208_9APIC|nr:dna-directed rna polymerase ii rpb11a [Cystoisospora suis]
MPKQSTMVNRLDAAEVSQLPPGVHKVEWVPDSRFPLCGTFVFHLEDYTVGYILRNDLLLDPRVKFVGLRQPHPLEPKIELRIQTVGGSPFSVVLESLRKRKAALSLLKARFKVAAGAAPVVQTEGEFYHGGGVDTPHKGFESIGHIDDDDDVDVEGVSSSRGGAGSVSGSGRIGSQSYSSLASSSLH